MNTLEKAKSMQEKATEALRNAFAEELKAGTVRGSVAVAEYLPTVIVAFVEEVNT